MSDTPCGSVYTNVIVCAALTAIVEFAGVTDTAYGGCGPDEGAVTVNATLAVADALPPVPPTLRLYVPVATELPTLMIALDVHGDPFTGFGLNVPVIPDGHPIVLSVTAELNPFTGVIVTCDVPVDPRTTLAAAAVIVKLGVAPPPPPTVIVPDCVHEPRRLPLSAPRMYTINCLPVHELLNCTEIANCPFEYAVEAGPLSWHCEFCLIPAQD